MTLSKWLLYIQQLLLFIPIYGIQFSTDSVSMLNQRYILTCFIILSSVEFSGLLILQALTKCNRWNTGFDIHCKGILNNLVIKSFPLGKTHFRLAFCLLPSAMSHISMKSLSLKMAHENIILIQPHTQDQSEKIRINIFNNIFHWTHRPGRCQMLLYKHLCY